MSVYSKEKAFRILLYVGVKLACHCQEVNVDKGFENAEGNI
jgi:hypothetical protein